MDLVSLISKSPELFEELKSLGMDSDQIVLVAGEMNRQVREQTGPDLTDILQDLDAQSFMSKLDIDALARCVNIDSALAGSVARTVAAAVQAFEGDLGSLVSNLTGALPGTRGRRT